MWELVIPAVASFVTLATGLLCYLSFREAQGPLQIIALRFKTVRMRIYVKSYERYRKHRRSRTRHPKASE